MVAGNGFRRKLVRYRNVREVLQLHVLQGTCSPVLCSPAVFQASSSFQQLVLAERTRLSEQYFSALQKFVVLDLGLSLLPVGGQTEASQLITQIVHGEGRENPFRRRTSCRLLDSITLAMVQQIPGVGKVRAVTLMQNFPSIQEISNASPAELEPLVGQASAQQIHSFFHAHLTPGN
ncbi:PREDICTED: Fanconi anemia core complex-associated protein 24 [Cyprinodon variegatus]|uniref:Fanconi anemia core complex-associated protein 24 n=1 Tax=Cyprinodon variegatus TaxID=28743 RepID=UPI0007426488|nr:PREDICTED: Fanconi anemia core complex-associated protein 24 [Cyprinodon variegatus]